MTARVAIAIDGAAPNRPAKLLGRKTSPSAANADTAKPPNNETGHDLFHREPVIDARGAMKEDNTALPLAAALSPAPAAKRGGAIIPRRTIAPVAAGD